MVVVNYTRGRKMSAFPKYITQKILPFPYSPRMADLGTRTLSKWTEQVEEERIPNLSSSKYLVSEKMNIPIITSIVFSK